MCGILFTTTETFINADVDEYLLNRIKCRGPDSCKTYSTCTSYDQRLTFISSVLHLRGPEVISQPLVDEDQNVLCWNGEAWAGLDISAGQSDTQALLQALKSVDDGVAKVFEQIRGPYAFVYYQARRERLWYGRDILGRRSLLQKGLGRQMSLASIGKRNGEDWREVLTSGIYCFNYADEVSSFYPWSTEVYYKHALTRPYSRVNTATPPDTIDTTDREQVCYAQPILKLKEVLMAAIKIRVDTIPEINAPSGTARVAVMYSGGVDCAVLARLLHEVLPSHVPIDLLNVSFENPRSLANAKKIDPGFDAIYDTPDRLTGLQGFQELLQTCPNRDWRFVKIDVPYAEALAEKETVLDLMFPNDSIMDYSIALAFYFCALGQGTMISKSEPNGKEYQCRAKVFFSGLGADEQLGGYSRHAAAFKSGSWPRLIQELQCDLDRIPTRNLGRDDRILSHFAREVRWPFLDESVVDLLCNLRVDCKMTFDMPGGDKIILRDLARSLGIVRAAGEKKRAVQFGSRSARMEIEHDKNDRVKGHQKQL